MDYNEDFARDWLALLQDLIPSADRDAESSHDEKQESEEEDIRSAATTIMNSAFRSRHLNKGVQSFLDFVLKPSTETNVTIAPDFSISPNNALVFIAHILNLNVGAIRISMGPFTLHISAKQLLELTGIPPELRAAAKAQYDVLQKIKEQFEGQNYVLAARLMHATIQRSPKWVNGDITPDWMSKMTAIEGKIVTCLHFLIETHLKLRAQTISIDKACDLILEKVDHGLKICINTGYSYKKIGFTGGHSFYLAIRKEGSTYNVAIANFGANSHFHESNPSADKPAKYLYLGRTNESSELKKIIKHGLQLRTNILESKSLVKTEVETFYNIVKSIKCEVEQASYGSHYTQIVGNCTTFNLQAAIKWLFQLAGKDYTKLNMRLLVGMDQVLFENNQ